MTQTQESTLRDEWGAIAPDFVARLAGALERGDDNAVRALAGDLHAADLGDLIAALEPGDRTRLIGALGAGFDVEALAELDEEVRDAVVEDLPNSALASAVGQLDTDDAVYLIEDMAEEDRREILDQVPLEDRAALSRALDYPEDTAGRLMKTEFVAVPSFWRIRRTIDHLREAGDLPDDFVEIYVVDPAFHLIGTVPLSRILRSMRSVAIDAIISRERTTFAVTDSREDVAYKFEKYNLVSAAVVDAQGRLVGSLMADDVVEIVQEETEEDLLHLGGVGEEEIGSSVLTTARSRFGWLFVNLFTAMFAAWVISWFGGSIEQLVALAVLMPVVASMGGNAGTQTMTVSVRALATRELGPVNALKVIGRECAVGLLNGVALAAIAGAFAWWWFGNPGLGAVIAAALTINLIAAALAGILIPLTLDRFDIDPAVSSGVFVTMVTDVVGFLAFLGLATWVLL